LLPRRARIISQPATAPGTVTVKMPLPGIRVAPLAFTTSGVRPVGAHPPALSPYSFPLFAS
jgi:hypothetical protein